MVKAVFFDVNETVLNLSLLHTSFDRYFGDKDVFSYWFLKLLHSSNTLAALDEYSDFGQLAEATLENVFYERGKELTKEAKTEILSSFRQLPAYDDVEEALALLLHHKIRTIAVSNSSLKMIAEQLRNAGLLSFFRAYYSVDSVRKYKPFKEIYQFVGQSENILPEDSVMVASHDWDLFGAKKAGLKTAYIKRKDEIYNPLYLQGDLQDTNLVNLAKQIIHLEV